MLVFFHKKMFYVLKKPVDFIIYDSGTVDIGEIMIFGHRALLEL